MELALTQLAWGERLGHVIVRTLRQAAQRVVLAGQSAGQS
jgi:hypothetical protein